MADMFKSERLIYRAITEKDDDFLLSMQIDTPTQVNGICHLHVPQGPQHGKASREFLSSKLMTAIVCLPSPGPSLEPTPIGFICLSGVDRPGLQHFRRTPLGIVLAPGYQGKGYGPEAIRWALEWAFRHAAMHKIFLHVYEFNVNAIKAYRKVGFVEDGRSREHVWHDGRFWDQFEYSILEHEWRKMQKDKAEASEDNKSK